MKIAVSGKGGVGKTLIAGALACSFARKGLKTIAIDADPSPNLALTLGLPIEKTREIVPISENKKLVESKTSTEFSGVYRIFFTVDDTVRDFSVQTPCNVNLIVMGTVRSMGSGCTCAANAVVRALLRHLVVERDEVVLLDMEAGVEHLGRGTAKHVDTMLIVTDSSIKSLETAKRIHKLAENAGIKQVFLVGNKVAAEIQRDAIKKFAENNSLNVLDFVPFDEQVVEAEMRGETPLKYEESFAVQTIEKLGTKITQIMQ
ncbi:MAG: P-loop NTPase [Candidatus Bathyarchaeota archaeon]|nr:P-loop NTPase [Candidatus Bathyarchaeota archaeon]MDH5495332.1 P-loop NTPase [Candidatus Bathyarchaeota archaeon]